MAAHPIGPKSSRAREPRARGLASLLLLVGLLAAAWAVPSGVGAAIPTCLNPATTNASGTALYVSACATEVTVTSPLVRTVYGSPGNDVIHAALNVETVYGGAGDDTIYAGSKTTLVEGGGGEDKIYGEPLENELGPEAVPYEPEVEYQPATSADAAMALRAGPSRIPQATASNVVICEGNPCLGGTGDQELHGGEGNDEIFGERGDDKLFGEGGNDALYGGIGDDELFGGKGEDFLAGGAGADILEGGPGNDLLRGDGTTDTLNGDEGDDTVSFSTGVTPGFEGTYPESVKHVSGFPESTVGEGRGVYVRLDGQPTTCGGYAACDGGGGMAGGDDTIVASGIENVIGTPFPDIIVGSSAANKIYGGGGGDVIIGDGGADELYGGAEGDYIEDSGSGTAYGGSGTNECSGLASTHECSGSEARVRQHEPSGTMTAGLMMNLDPVAGHDTVYMIGTEGEDEVNAHYVAASHEVTFTSYGTTKFGGASEGCTYEEGGKVASEGKTARCPLPAASQSLDAVVMAGMGGNDHLAVGGEPAFELTTNPVLLGGQGNDVLSGSGKTEDVLVDGPGNDTLKAYGYDDWLLNNAGTDVLEGGAGNDLLLSTTLCEGDTLQGAEAETPDGEARNDASWAKLPKPQGVVADINKQSAGSGYEESTKTPTCATGSVDHLYGIDDLEGSSQNDLLIGDEHENLLIGHLGEDTLLGEGGEDKLSAEDGFKDKVIGGPPAPPEPGEDECVVDLALDEVAGCEDIIPKPKTETSISEPEPHNGSPGSVTVKGTVKAEASLAGRHVLVEYEKEEGGKFVLKDHPEVTLPENGDYTDSEGVGVGKWRVRAVFPAQGNYEASASGYHEFTIKS